MNTFVSFSEYVERTLEKAVYKKDEGEGWVVIIPSLPGCVTQGETLEEAKEMARDAIEGWITLAIQFGDHIPPIDDCVLSPQIYQVESAQIDT